MNLLPTMLFAALVCVSSAMAQGMPSIEKLTATRVDLLALCQAVQTAFMTKEDLKTKPLDVSPVFFSAVLDPSNRVYEYSLCSVRCLRVDPASDEIQFETWLVLMARTKYESMELWEICSAVEEGVPDEDLGALKIIENTKAEPKVVHALLSKWGALGEIGARKLWENHDVLTLAVEASAWGKVIGEGFDFRFLKK